MHETCSIWLYEILDMLRQNAHEWIKFIRDWEGSWCGPSMKLYNWIKTYENWLILFILTRCNFFSKVCTVIVGGKMWRLILNLGVMFNSLSAYLDLP